MIRNQFRLLSLATFVIVSHNSFALDTPQDTLKLATSLCLQPNEIPAQLTDYESTQKEIIVRGLRVGSERLCQSKTHSLKLDIIEPTGRPKRTALSASDGQDINKPGIWMILDDKCILQEAKRAVYENNTAIYIETFDNTLTPTGYREWLNPPLPDAGKLDGLRVALVDSGVNYQIDEIARSLAIDSNGELIGYDFWDDDPTPFDANPARSWFFIQRHGTRTASILLREAPDVALVPYRYPRPDMSRMKQLIEHAAANSIRIIAMPLGSNDHKEWTAFSKAVDTHPDILFVVSAGNNGRNIDSVPVYPAAFDHPNILVVTSADDYIQPAERTNYGMLSVDYLLPAENIPAIDFSGEETLVSGSSYAVSRLTALAARLLMTQPDIPIAKLKELIRSYSVRANTSAYVSTGYIGDPIADTAKISSHEDTTFKPVIQASEFTAALNIVALTDNWVTDKITEALNQTNTIFSQCGLSVNALQLIRVSGPDYISNLSPGRALTLSRYFDSGADADKQLIDNRITIFFAEDTNMQIKFDAEAFGQGNTGNRPWMTNTLWITSVTPDTGNALAHELFHILSNSGQHSTDALNLMQSYTSPNNTRLTPMQCQGVIESARESGLIN